MQLGNVTYTTAEISAILAEPVGNNGLLVLAKQLISTKINLQCHNTDPSCIQQTVADSDFMIGDLVIPPIGNGFLTSGQVNNLATILLNYNQGRMCAHACADPPCPTPTPTPSPTTTPTATPTPDPTPTPTATPTPTPAPTPTPTATPTSTPAPTPTATPTPGVPSVVCDTSAASNIGVTVTAGDGGAPTGFTIEWETLADYDASAWNPANPSFCSADFRGQIPDCSTYILGAGQSVTVVIGDDHLFDNGCVTSQCAGHPLVCNTAYAFHVRANGGGEFSDTISCATQPCVPPTNCTYTQGYWKTHPNAWSVSSLTAGAISYTQSQLLQILNQPAQGNGLIILAHQLIAAKLNVAHGADPADAAQAIADADAMIGSLAIPPVGSGYLSPSQTSELTDSLTEYNEGTIGPGHCDD